MKHYPYITAGLIAFATAPSNIWAVQVMSAIAYGAAAVFALVYLKEYDRK